MKHVYYKHKESESYISIQQLKEMKDRCTEIEFHICKPIVFNQHFPIDLPEITKPIQYRYNIKEIPFSEDFEIVVIDEEDFNLFDLNRLISSVKNDVILPIGTFNKLKKKFDTLFRLYHEYNTPKEIRKIIE